ncbi:TRAP-type C4-dicarboxylate transport system permease small subunit [Limimaricola soesokkakensis]|uniref:TRAP transporter small permease protein n=2 Tax=Limimaricola soesokkakensis TaxID=1343159 RepID=A0A1X6ZEN2_9RHOB|nr:TRAP-type C4-dicarboxylate transport system permease small subunit [Limimaricola soesokkakensis]SLN47466.1 2,3-diketo-L-gulonate TRAP transporter small permease protein YiaM [Limimaricola soesokkakensis]
MALAHPLAGTSPMTAHTRLTAGLDTALYFLRNACLFVASICLVVLIASFGWLVFGRYVLNATPTWVEQLSLLLVGYITFLGAAAGIHDDGHLGVTFLRDGFGPRFSSVLRSISDLAMTGFGLVMFTASTELVRFGWSSQLPMLNLPEGMRAIPAAICGLLAALFCGTRALRRMLGDRPATDAFILENI